MMKAPILLPILLNVCSAGVAQPYQDGQDPSAPSVSITLHMNEAYPISPMLYGCFFEDINYSADGGIYAEMIQNRDFEYSEADFATPHEWSHDFAWHTIGTDISLCDANP